MGLVLRVIYILFGAVVVVANVRPAVPVPAAG
jgi:hypothetical protein